MKHTLTLIDAFWCRVEKSNGCWLWKGSLAPSGYGTFYYNYAQYRAHRMSYQLEYGDIPPETEVCHSCDNKACVNPAHLFATSHKDNMADMSNKGRAARLQGDRNGMAKLTYKIVAEIRARYALGGISQRQLAKEYSISQGNVWQIVNNRYWKTSISAGEDPQVKLDQDEDVLQE